MNIESSPIHLASQQASSRYFAIEETLHAWVGTQRPNLEGHANQSCAASESSIATISEAARRAAANAQAGTGKDALSSVAQRNVSTLYLGNIATSLDLMNSGNALLGLARTSGSYLSQDGAAATLRQIDLVV